MHAVLRTLLVASSLAVIANAIASESPASSQAASEPIPTSAAPPLNTITVEGKREVIEKQINEFATSVMVHSDRVSLSRRRGRICPLVTGLPAELNDFVRARLTEVAGSVGAPRLPLPIASRTFTSLPRRTRRHC
jgi:hypothetical protein